MGADLWTNCALFLLQWHDEPTAPFQPSYARHLFTGTGKGSGNIVDFYDAISHGRVDLSDSKVFGWHFVGHTLAAYQAKVQEFMAEDSKNNTSLAGGKSRALQRTARAPHDR